MQRFPNLASLLLFLVAGCVGLFPAPALADGKVFARLAAVPTIPDQEALIFFEAGIQTLVIDTRFVVPSNPSLAAPLDSASPADPSEDEPPFAWVVPVPAAGGTPEVLASTPGLFPTLRAAFSPRIVDRGADPQLTVGMVLFGLFLLLAMQCRSSVSRLGVCLLLVFPLGLMLIPALGTARSSTQGITAIGGVEILDRKLVGAFDVAVIAATPDAPNPGDALAAWLNTSGFHIPTGVEPVLADYASRNWCFVAARLHAPDDPSTARLSPHPLALRFKTDQPVYPLKLTGVGNGPLKVDLYIFGPEMARADGFDVVRCAPASIAPPAPERGSTWVPSNGAIALDHEGLRSFVPVAAVATKLSATLNPEQMTSDAAIRWASPRWTGAALYTSRGITDRAVLAAAATFLAGIVIILLAVTLGRIERSATLAWTLAPLLASGLGAGITYAVLPRVQGSVVYESRVQERTWHRMAWQNLFVQLTELEKSRGPEAVTLDAARAVLAEFIAEARSNPDNPREQLMAQRIREEDSPGNYLLRERADGSGAIEYLWFDSTGRAHHEWVWSR